MNTDNTQDKAEPSPASAGSHNTHMATARLSAANTWLQEEIKRLRLTDEEREAMEAAAALAGLEAAATYNENNEKEKKFWSDCKRTLRKSLERLK
jgi:hypothetical protein